jgi:hypothetical protein
MARHKARHSRAARQKTGLPGSQMVPLGRVFRVDLEKPTFYEQHICAECQVFDP